MQFLVKLARGIWFLASVIKSECCLFLEIQVIDFQCENRVIAKLFAIDSLKFLTKILSLSGWGKYFCKVIWFYFWLFELQEKIYSILLVVYWVKTEKIIKSRVIDVHSFVAWLRKHLLWKWLEIQIFNW